MENFQLRPLQWWAESAPLGQDRVKVSENLGATSVAPVAPADTSYFWSFFELPNKLAAQFILFDKQRNHENLSKSVELDM